jgi:hypothetical protein
MENLAIAHGTTLVLNLDHLKRIRVATVPSAICATCRHSARKQKKCDFVTVRERMPLHENLAIARGTTLVLNLDHLKRIRVATVPSAICATCRCYFTISVYLVIRNARGIYCARKWMSS